jgi:hypothetical protein
MILLDHPHEHLPIDSLLDSLVSSSPLPIISNNSNPNTKNVSTQARDTPQVSPETVYSYKLNSTLYKLNTSTKCITLSSTDYPFEVCPNTGSPISLISFDTL